MVVGGPVVVVVAVRAVAVTAGHDALEVAGAQGALTREVGVLLGLGVAAVVAGAPAVAAGEDVLDALVCCRFSREAAPGGDEGTAVEVLDLDGVSGFGDACRSGCEGSFLVHESGMN